MDFAEDVVVVRAIYREFQVRFFDEGVFWNCDVGEPEAADDLFPIGALSKPDFIEAGAVLAAPHRRKGHGQARVVCTAFDAEFAVDSNTAV